MKMSYEEWYKHQQKVIQEEYAKIREKIVENAHRQFDNTNKESLIKVAVKDEDLRSR